MAGNDLFEFLQPKVYGNEVTAPGEAAASTADRRNRSGRVALVSSIGRKSPSAGVATVGASEAREPNTKGSLSIK
ncbi:hypothetical protein SeMB42_g00117 [Synchytrium endobioticum]|nr:hypothetical protein SeMB42_g00117 [Synchytrium endobioticum]